MSNPHWVHVKIATRDYMEHLDPIGQSKSFPIHSPSGTYFLVPPLVGVDCFPRERDPKRIPTRICIAPRARLAWVPEDYQTALPDHILVLVHPEDIIPNWFYGECTNEEG